MCRADFDLDNAEEKVRHRRWVARHLQPSCRPVGIFAKPELTNHAINSRARGSNKQAIGKNVRKNLYGSDWASHRPEQDVFRKAQGG
jgi:hypothetical protein